MDDEKMENILEEQKERRKERQSQRELSHINESQLTEPAKQAIESEYCPDTGNITWYEEPDIFVRKREPDEPASKVTERPDLLCEWQPSEGGPSTLYLIELKVRLNKRAIGQLISYYWATRNGLKIVDGDKEYILSGEEVIVLLLGGMRYKKPYYDDLIDWLRESLDLGTDAGIETLPLKPD